MRGSSALERGLLAVHAVLLVSALAAVVASAHSAPVRALLGAAAAAPLLAVLPGLYRGSVRTYQWTGLLMVLFAGAATVETVATLGRSPLVSLMLLASLLELALLFVLTRRR
ncbi:MAG TPA: DUF2069 domain-containing protein [Gammaproteobacteria bacterium]|nr:DUF2069 domain-containing protein [Gammaproteobacteria bacterium]